MLTVYVCIRVITIPVSSAYIQHLFCGVDGERLRRGIGLRLVRLYDGEGCDLGVSYTELEVEADELPLFECTVVAVDSGVELVADDVV